MAFRVNTKTKSVLKYAVAACLLWLILHHVDTAKIEIDFQRISPLHLLLALVFVTIAQLISALRMRFLFRASEFMLNRKFAVILFYVGAFYNFLLPGGIGGDAYKVILVKKRMEIPAAQGIRLMLADRASGLCIMMLIILAMLYQIDISHLFAYQGMAITLGIVVTLGGFLFFCQWLLKQHPRTMLCSLPYSFGVQMLWVCALAALWSSLGQGRHLVEYVVLYCAASIVSMLPVSVGGLGIKEMTYYYGAKLFHQYALIDVDPELGITLSLCIFVLLFVASLPGLVWLNKVTTAHHS
jgi:uncharacterized membrane protein YbhN (UPF0104 family)